jgi:hypothetical protein
MVAVLKRNRPLACQLSNDRERVETIKILVAGLSAAAAQ